MLSYGNGPVRVQAQPGLASIGVEDRFFTGELVLGPVDERFLMPLGLSALDRAPFPNMTLQPAPGLFT
jgi:hypothetical protein